MFLIIVWFIHHDGCRPNASILSIPSRPRCAVSTLQFRCISFRQSLWVSAHFHSPSYFALPKARSSLLMFDIVMNQNFFEWKKEPTAHFHDANLQISFSLTRTLSFKTNNISLSLAPTMSLFFLTPIASPPSQLLLMPHILTLNICIRPPPFTAPL